MTISNNTLNWSIINKKNPNWIKNESSKNYLKKVNSFNKICFVQATKNNSKMFFLLHIFILPILTNSIKLRCSEWSTISLDSSNCIVESIDVLKNDSLELDKIDSTVDSFYFHNSKVEVFPLKLFTAFPKMVSFSMTDNFVKQLNAKMFAKAGNLKILVFTNTSTKVLKNKVFVNLANLSSLTINKNKLKNIMMNSFQVIICKIDKHFE